MTLIRCTVPWMVGAGILLLLGWLHPQLETFQGKQDKIHRFQYMPNGHFLRTASLGYREFVADLLWLQAIQAMGERKVSPDAGQWLYKLLDVMTTVDPKFVRAYEAGGIALCTLVVLPEESNRLLEKGMFHNPQEWKLPFILGINYAFELGDDAKAAEAIARAARLPGAPDDLARLASNFFVSAKAPQQAVDLLINLYERTPDKSAKVLLGERLKRIMVERDLLLLEQAIERYSQTQFRLPSSLEDLVTNGILRELPTEPNGGKYVYEGRTGNVWSSAITERVRLSMRRRAQ